MIIKKCAILFGQIFALLLLLASQVIIAADRGVEAPYDEVWKRAVQAVVLEGVKLSVSDKDTGVIQGSGEFDKDSKYFSCSRVPGRVESYLYNISIVIRENSGSSNTVSVKAEGIAKSYKFRHLVVIRTSRVYYDTPCESTGVLEDKLLSQISQ